MDRYEFVAKQFRKRKHLVGGRSTVICVIIDVRHCRESKEGDKMVLLRNLKP